MRKKVMYMVQIKCIFTSKFTLFGMLTVDLVDKLFVGHNVLASPGYFKHNYALL